MLALAAALVAWHGLHGGSGGIGRSQLPAAPPPAAAADRLIVEPDAGMQPIYSLLGAPRHRLDLTMYELDDPTAEAILADDAARGVAVRVLLDHRLEAAHDAAAYSYLTARHVAVHWAGPRYFVTHEKTFVIDGSRAVVMSLNLASRYYATSRDVAVVDPDRADAAAIEAVFDADFAGRSTGTPAADDLVWSPRQSAADLIAMITHARRSLLVESEELNSAAVVGALVAAARRGVAVRVAMTFQSDWQPAFDAVSAAGGQVSVMYGERPLYIHAKLLVADAGMPHAMAFVGSENLSDASLFSDRELGIVLLGRPLVDQVARVVDSDFRSGTPTR